MYTPLILKSSHFILNFKKIATKLKTWSADGRTNRTGFAGPEGSLYGENVTGRRPVGRPALRFKDVCKRDLKFTGIGTGNWESLAADRNGWRHAVSSGVKSGERMRILRLEEKREQRKASQQNVEVNLRY